MLIDYPYGIDDRGRTRGASYEAHLRDLIEQVLFTAPGERVNRPTFGSGLMHLLFAPNDDALAAAVQMSVHGGLQQWLGDLIVVQAVEVESEDSTLRVRVDYVIRKTGESAQAEFVREA